MNRRTPRHSSSALVLLVLLLATLATIGGALLASPAAAQRTRVVVDEAQVAETAEGARSALNIPAIAVGVVGPDGPRYLSAHGAAELDEPFIIGSLSKSVTAMAVMLLVDDGALSLDDPVSQWVADVPEELTVRHMLHHRSGLSRDDGGNGWTDRDATITRMVAEATWDAPGAFSYCNLNYQLLGEVVTEVSGRRFGDFVRARIFEPLAMTHASADPLPPTRHITGHQYVFGLSAARGEPAYNPLAVPSGFVWMSANDMARWLRIFLDHGRVDGRQVIPASVIDALLTPPAGSPYAMGWAVGESDGVVVASHSGLTGAFAASMAIAPQREVGVFALANINSWSARAERDLVEGLLASYLGQEAEPMSNLELVLRAILGVIVALVLLAFAVELARWLGAGLPRGLDDRARLRVAITILVAVALHAAPFAFGSSLSLVIRVQPDLGLGLLAIVVLGTLRVILRGFNATRLRRAEL